MRKLKKLTRRTKIVSFSLALLMVVSMMTAMLGNRQNVLKAKALSPSTAIKMSNSYKSGSYYQKLLNVNLTGNQAEDIVAIAKSQIGYKSGANSNDMAGTTNSTSNVKYSEYGYAIGSNPNDWCAYFVSWCARQAGISDNVFPSFPGCTTAYNTTLPTHGCVMNDRGNGYSPKKGDLIFFGTSSKTYHVGLVDYSSNGVVYYIDGNNTSTIPHCVHYSHANLTYTEIRGYATPKYNGSTVTHTVDSNYPTNFTATAKSKMTVFGSNHESVGNHYVDAGDVCTIHEVYTDGCCRVTYPTGSGTETYYCYISNFEWAVAPTWASISVNKNDFVAGETISFTFNGNNSPTSYIIGIDKDGTRIVTEESGNSYSISRLKPGNYSAYVTAKNSVGSADSSKVYFTVNYKYPGPVDVGTNFYAYIINTEVWQHATNDNTNVALHEETGYPNQIWRFERQDDLSYKIINMYDNKALEVQGISPDIGANVQVHTYGGNNAQLWYIYGTSGAFRLRAKCTDCFLDLKNGSSDDRDNLRMWEDLDNADQKFQIWKIDYFKEVVNLGEEFYSLILMTSAWKPLTNDDGNVILSSERGDSSQIWKFKRTAEGSYYIISAKDGKYLDVVGFNGNNGANVGVYEMHGDKNQRWFIHREDGGFSISTACNGVSHNQVLSIEGSAPNDGANVNMYEWIGALDQIYSIYAGEECVPLKSSTLSVTPGNAQTDTQFSWTNVYGRGYYDLKLWNGKYWEGDAIYYSWNNTDLSQNAKLQAGYYEGYVDSRHALDCKMSNVVCFTVKPVLKVAKQNNGEYNFSWNSVLSADSYKIEVVNTKTNQTVISRSVSKETSSLNISISAGDYKARIVSSFSKAYQPSDGSNAISSINSDYVSFTVTASNPATAITLSKTSLSLKKGDQSTLTAIVTPNDSSDSVTWTSSNTAVATVSNGTVSAIGNGSATITAKAGSKSATCAVTVTNPATAITLSKTSLSLKKGEKSTLTATVTPNDSSDSVTWTSSNTAVATVSNGTVTAVGNGSATITAKAGSKSATCAVTVTNPATGITLSKTSLSMKKGDKSTLTATVTPNDSSDSVTWTSSNTAVATVSNGTVTAVGNGSATITAKAGIKSATCAVTVTEPTPTAYDVTPNINGGASKLYEPWGLRYYAVFNGADIDKISDRGIAILKDTYYTSGMTPAQFCANQNANIFLSSRNELTFEEATSSNPKGRYFATLTKGIYSYDIGAKYYVVPFAVMNNGQTIYGTIKNNSMENILKANLNLSTITKEEKAICTCILELKKSVAAHYEAAGVPGASVDMNIPRGSSQSAANVKSTTATGITPNVVGGASRLIEPWGLRYFATYTDSSNIVQRGMVILSEKYYQSSYSSSPDKMRLNANAYVFRDSDGTLLYQSETNRYYGTVTEGISSKDIADVYYVVPFAVLNDGSYVYGTVKSNSMMKIMKANLNSSSVPATERAVSQDIIDLYNAVKAYYAVQ